MEYLTIKELAKILKVTPRTIQNWIDAGLPVIRIQGVLRFKLNEIEKWIEERRK